jgi:hypothetical protein
MLLARLASCTIGLDVSIGHAKHREAGRFSWSINGRATPAGATADEGIEAFDPLAGPSVGVEPVGAQDRREQPSTDNPVRDRKSSPR